MKLKNKCGIMILLTSLSASALANVNINKAGKDELLKNVSGLTPEQAQAIVDYRKDQGAIVKLHELYILGVSPDVIEANYSKLEVGNVSWADKKPDRNVDYTTN